jgi:hypothetical protein
VFLPLVDLSLDASLGPTELRPGSQYLTRDLARSLLVAKARKALRPPVAPLLRPGQVGPMGGGQGREPEEEESSRFMRKPLGAYTSLMDVIPFMVQTMATGCCMLPADYSSLLCGKHV